jgi:hypothetical protein
MVNLLLARRRMVLIKNWDCEQTWYYYSSSEGTKNHDYPKKMYSVANLDVRRIYIYEWNCLSGRCMKLHAHKIQKREKKIHHKPAAFKKKVHNKIQKAKKKLHHKQSFTNEHQKTHAHKIQNAKKTIIAKHKCAINRKISVHTTAYDIKTIIAVSLCVNACTETGQTGRARCMDCTRRRGHDFVL